MFGGSLIHSFSFGTTKSVLFLYNQSVSRLSFQYARTSTYFLLDRLIMSRLDTSLYIPCFEFGFSSFCLPSSSSFVVVGLKDFVRFVLYQRVPKRCLRPSVGTIFELSRATSCCGTSFAKSEHALSLLQLLWSVIPPGTNQKIC